MCNSNIKKIVFTLLICFLDNHNALAQTSESPAFQVIDHENELSDNITCAAVAKYSGLCDFFLIKNEIRTTNF